MTLCFQNMILNLHNFWAKNGCTILQSYDTEMGAGTFHPATTLRSLGPESWFAAYVQPSRRPTDGQYGENPYRMQHYYQYQVILKPSPNNIQDIYLQSLKSIGIDTSVNDIRFVEDNWESPTLGAAGVGWEIWCNGMEITQFTYFQQMGGYKCHPVSTEITYGLERLALIIQKCENIFSLDWNGTKGNKNIKYGDLFKRNEKEFSQYNFKYANKQILHQHFIDTEYECKFLLEKKLPLPAYDQCLKSSHIFNILDARGLMSVTQRTSFIIRIRKMVKNCCQEWINSLSKI